MLVKGEGYRELAMPYRITAADRAMFKRCRRQWDLGSGGRRSLVPAREPAHAAVDLALALRDALAVYYFPGMWDWERSIVLPLVRKGLERSIERQRAAGAALGAEAALARGGEVLEAYFDWAPGVDRFSPIRTEVGFEVNLPDPGAPGSELVAMGGQPVRYLGLVELLVADAKDRYWVVSHRVRSDGFAPRAQLLLDEEPVVSAWAWERFQLDVVVVGTIHNELRPGGLGAPGQGAGPAAGGEGAHPRGGLPQHEASGGGRSVPFHRRIAAERGGERSDADHEPGELAAEGTAAFRRTWIRRERAELDAAGTRLAEEAMEMLDPALALYANPTPANCAACPFVDPCVAANEGLDVEAVLEAGYRRADPLEGLRTTRWGMSAWGMGRGGVLPGG